MSITARPPTPSGADPDDLRSAWYAASRRRLGLTEAVWYDPAVEPVIRALTLDEPLDAAVTELGHARGSAGFGLRETAADLAALAEILPTETAERIHDEGIPALSAWADAFIDRVHPPACVDALTGLVTPAYLRVRLAEVHRECNDRRLGVSHAYALVVVGPKEFPTLLRSIGKYVGMIRKQAALFREQWDDAMRQSELADLKKQVEQVGHDIKSTVSETEAKVQADIAAATQSVNDAISTANSATLEAPKSPAAAAAAAAAASVEGPLPPAAAAARAAAVATATGA